MFCGSINLSPQLSSRKTPHNCQLDVYNHNHISAFARHLQNCFFRLQRFRYSEMAELLDNKIIALGLLMMNHKHLFCAIHKHIRVAIQHFYRGTNFDKPRFKSKLGNSLVSDPDKVISFLWLWFPCLQYGSNNTFLLGIFSGLMR